MTGTELVYHVSYDGGLTWQPCGANYATLIASKADDDRLFSLRPIDDPPKP